jgi:hypothetical protein
MPTKKTLVIVYGGELAKDVAEQILAHQPADLQQELTVTLRCASERPKTLVEFGSDTAVCFVLQTIENEAATEEVSDGFKMCRDAVLLLTFFSYYLFRAVRAYDFSRERHTPTISWRTSFLLPFWVSAIRTFCLIGKRRRPKIAIKWRKNLMHGW